MSDRPIPLPHPPGRPNNAARLTSATASRSRHVPSQGALTRRRIAIRVAKWLLPATALGLLSLIALWPELENMNDQARLAFRRMSEAVGGARLIDAQYHGIDDAGRPYTVTASVAQQDGPERINLTTPKGDITLGDGTWLMLQSKQGVYMQHAQQLDLSRDVTLYRDDGTTMVTASASIDLKNGVATGSEPVHAEGPFGTLDAKGGFTLVDKGAAVQFTGPAHLVLNGAGQ
jgi:lipopolysaccharide export system protein LptC